MLKKAVDRPRHAARIGGDEFAILLPATDERRAALVVDTIKNLVDLNNQFYSAVPIDLSIGIATGEEGERIEEIAKRADANMYIARRQHYLTRESDALPGDAAD